MDFIHQEVPLMNQNHYGQREKNIPLGKTKPLHNLAGVI